MARILRGEIRWADLDPTRGHEQAGGRDQNEVGQDADHGTPAELASFPPAASK